MIRFGTNITQLIFILLFLIQAEKSIAQIKIENKPSSNKSEPSDWKEKMINEKHWKVIRLETYRFGEYSKVADSNSVFKAYQFFDTAISMTYIKGKEEYWPVKYFEKEKTFFIAKKGLIQGYKSYSWEFYKVRYLDSANLILQGFYDKWSFDFSTGKFLSDKQEEDNWEDAQKNLSDKLQEQNARIRKKPYRFLLVLKAE
jgi:hypothetical protein